MAIYAPTPTFSKTDRRLLALLAKLLLENHGTDARISNLAHGMALLSEAEAAELADLLERFLASKETREAQYFVEGLTSPSFQNDAALREIYLSRRKRNGRTRSVASMHWSNFLVRLGIEEPMRRAYISRLSSGVPMELDHFLQMEKRLLDAAGLNPRVTELALRVVRSQTPRLGEVRTGEATLDHGAIERLLAIPLQRDITKHVREISSRRIVYIVILVADFSVLFTTRDWSVAGTLSTIAGALAGIAAD